MGKAIERGIDELIVKLPPFPIDGNRMLEHSDYVVAYATHSWGGAAQFVEKAKKRGRKVIYI